MLFVNGAFKSYNNQLWLKIEINRKKLSYSFKSMVRMSFASLLRRRLVMLLFWYLLDLPDLQGDETGENLTHGERNTFAEDLTLFLEPKLPKKKINNLYY